MQADVLTLPLAIPGDRPFDVVGLGENSVDHLCVVPQYPSFGGKVPIERYELQGGGQIATAMVACQRLGLRARYLGKVGDDALGELAIGDLRREGVDVSTLRVEPGAKTQFAFILIDAQSGERTVAWHDDQRLVLAPHELAAADVTSGRVLHVDATGVPSALTAVRWARAAGVVTSIDIDHVPPGAPELLGLIDLCIMSRECPLELTGERERERALHAVRRWNPHGLLCVTLGAEGCMALDGDEIVYSPGFRVAAVDTTACGDVFHGAFIYGALAGWDLARALRFANAAAALKTRKLGGRPGIPTLAEVEAFLAAHPG
jgi:sugar/nucleoside kinase (ribokinase family)